MIPVIGTRTRTGGSAASGTVTLTPSRRMRNAGTTQPASYTFTLNADGEIPDGSEIAAVDDGQTFPSGVYYTVTEVIDGETHSYTRNAFKHYPQVDLGVIDDLPDHVNSKNYVDLRDFAAAPPTGTGNDSGVFVAALAAAESGPRRLYVPRMPFPWIIGTTVTIPGDMEIFGDGWGPTFTTPTIKLGVGFNGFAFQTRTDLEDGCRVVFRDLEIDGNCSGQTTGGGCVRAYNPVHCLFDTVHFHHAYDVALLLHGLQGDGPFGHHVRIVDSLFDNSGQSDGNGQALRIQSTDEVYVHNCDFENNGGDGDEPYHIKDWSGLNTFIQNVFVGGGEAIRLQDCSGSRVIGNMFDGVNRDTVSMSGYSHQIVGNYFSGVGDDIDPNTYRHLHINNGGHHTVTGNTFWTGNTVQGLRAVISHEQDAEFSTFVGNTVRVTQAPGDGGIFDWHGGSAVAQTVSLVGNVWDEDLDS